MNNLNIKDHNGRCCFLQNDAFKRNESVHVLFLNKKNYLIADGVLFDDMYEHLRRHTLDK
jgi:DNA repair protein RadC